MCIKVKRQQHITIQCIIISYENVSQVKPLRFGQVPKAGVVSAIHGPTFSGIWYNGTKKQQNLLL